MHDVDKGNIIQCITMISPVQQITILDHVQIITMWTLGRVGTMHKNFTYSIMLGVFSTNCTQNYASIIGTGLYITEYLTH